LAVAAAAATVAVLAAPVIFHHLAYYRPAVALAEYATVPAVVVAVVRPNQDVVAVAAAALPVMAPMVEAAAVLADTLVEAAREAHGTAVVVVLVQVAAVVVVLVRDNIPQVAVVLDYLVRAVMAPRLLGHQAMPKVAVVVQVDQMVQQVQCQVWAVLAEHTAVVVVQALRVDADTVAVVVAD